MLINHLQEIDWTTLRISNVNMLLNKLFDLANIREINVKISDLIYNQSHCITLQKYNMFVTSIISANNSNKLQKNYITVKIIQHFCKHKIFFFSSNIFFFIVPKVKVKIFSSRQNKNLETLFKKVIWKIFHFVTT